MAAAAAAPRLDPEVVALVLQHVSLWDRIRSCSRVCKDWKAGVALATQQLVVHNCAQPKLTALTAWLHSNASHIGAATTLELVRPARLKGRPCPAAAWRSFPWAGLQGLQHVCIDGMAGAPTAAPARQAATAAGAAPAAVLPRLTSLELAHDGLSLLGAVGTPALRTPALRQLVCRDDTTQCHPSVVAAVAAACGALVRALPLLQHLAALELHGRVCDGRVLAAASGLTALQHLELHVAMPGKPRKGVDGLPASAFASLPASLTSLEVTVQGRILHIGPPALSQLTALQELTMQHQGSIQAGVLSSMGGLRRLVLRGPQLLPASGPGLGLQPFGNLTSLEHLELACGLKGSTSAPAADAAYLTASSHLTSLQLQEDLLDLPSDAFSSMFTACQLPDLLDLTIGSSPLCSVSAMQHLVNCCPKLQRLTLQPSSENRADQEELESTFLPEPPEDYSDGVRPGGLAALPALADLQELSLPFTGVPLSSDGWAALAACSRLAGLSVKLDARSSFQVRHAMQGLTKLRQLTRLEVRASFGQRDPLYDCSCKDSIEAPHPSPPEVWWQTLVQMMAVLRDEFSSKCWHNVMDCPGSGAVYGTQGAAYSIIRELEEELAQLSQQRQQQPPSVASQGQQQVEQHDGPREMLTRAIQGLKDALASFDEATKEWAEYEAEAEAEREREIEQRRRDFYDAFNW